MKDELGGKIITKFVGLRAKTYSCFIDDGSEVKKAKATKQCVIKIKIKFENYKSCLEAAQLKNKINHLEKNKINIDSLKKIIKNSKETINQYQKHKKDLKMKGIIFLLKKLITLL